VIRARPVPAAYEESAPDAAVYASADADLTALYSRISEDRQQGAGVRDQLTDCTALAQRKGWTRTLKFQDNDISASKYARKRRPDYQRLLAMVRAGQVRRIVVAHMDRLYRTMKELEELIDLTETGKPEIVSVYSGPLDLSTSDGRAAARILVAISSKASEDTSRRVRRAVQRRREAGESTGGPRPFGWAKVTVTDPDGTTRETWDPMTPDPAEAALIREAATAIIEGASLADIARRWNADGISQPQAHRAAGADSSPRWTTTHVRRVLTSPRQAGLVPRHREERDEHGTARMIVEAAGPAKWPAIIDRATWERCRQVLDSRSPQWAAPRRRSLLTSLVICGNCGANMTRDSHQQRKVWRCPCDPGKHGADGKTACGRLSIGAGELEEYVTRLTLEAADQANVDELVSRKSAGNDEYRRLARELTDIQRQYDEAAASAARRRQGGDGMTMRAYEKFTVELEDREREVQRQLAQLADTSILMRFAGRKGALRAAWESNRLTFDERRAAIKETIGAVAILPAGPDRAPISQRTIATAAGFTPLRMQPSTPAA
jgi:site-specific DNA recombinase